ncbi:helix-turn-helix transcriptional regulator [Mucilaginibacter sp. CAU 1740]|uniref:helix-turn-helix domain-containing protein n=1 Tax=Mucilaginibacter sp. CAU 1740 TaxID=3140365 RepID=UPI00325B5DCD
MEAEVDKKVKGVINTIRNIREQKQYSQEYMAAKLSISQNAYSKIELTSTLLSLERLLQIANILEVEATLLLQGKEMFSEQPTIEDL